MVDGLSYTQNKTEGGWYYSGNSGLPYAESTSWVALGLEMADLRGSSYGVIVNHYLKDYTANFLYRNQLADGSSNQFASGSYSNLVFTGGDILIAGWLGTNTWSSSDSSLWPSSSNYTKGQLRQKYDNYMSFVASQWTVANRVSSIVRDGLWQNGDYLQGNTNALYNAGTGGDTYSMFWRAMGNRALQPSLQLVGTHDWQQEFTVYLARSQERGLSTSDPFGSYATFGRVKDTAAPPWGNFAFVAYVDSTGGWNTILAGLAMTTTTLGGMPVAAIRANTTQTVPGGVIAFNATDSYHSDSSRKIVSYLWDFNASDGLNWSTPDATGIAATHRFSSPGTYTITLRVVDDNSPATAVTTTQTITVQAVPSLPPAANSGGPYTIDVGQSLTLNGSATDPNLPWGSEALTYSWDFHNNGTWGDATGANPTLTWAQLSALGISGRGRYTIGLKVTDSTAQTSIATASLIVYRNEPVAVIDPVATGILGAPLTFGANSSYHEDPSHRIVKYAWQFGDGQSALGTTVAHNYAAPGAYVITLTVMDQAGATDTKTATVNIQDSGGNRAPVARLSKNSGTWGEALVLDGSQSFDPDASQGDSIVKYEWDLNGDGTYDVISSQAVVTVPWETLLAFGPPEGRSLHASNPMAT